MKYATLVFIVMCVGAILATPTEDKRELENVSGNLQQCAIAAAVEFGTCIKNIKDVDNSTPIGDKSKFEAFMKCVGEAIKGFIKCYTKMSDY